MKLTSRLAIIATFLTVFSTAVGAHGDHSGFGSDPIGDWLACFGTNVTCSIGIIIAGGLLLLFALFIFAFIIGGVS